MQTGINSLNFRRMNQQAIVKDIMERAHAARIPIAKLCRMVGIDSATFWNWRKTPRNPNPCGANLHSIERIYQALDEIDHQDTKRLAKRGKTAA
ncbi:hypothetical protein [Parasphingorhabdus sp.]|uniref:hypothetical protein n=1 Tax=Parasphingorhabdus sp. TaxID=2709688 RepID=UPI003001AA9F